MKKYIGFLFFLIYFLLLSNLISFANEIEGKRFSIELPSVAIKNVKASEVIIKAESKSGDDWVINKLYHGSPKVSGIANIKGSKPDLSSEVKLNFVEGVAILKDITFLDKTIIVSDKNWSENKETINFIPGFLSLAPPLIAIFLALIFRNVLISLFAGVWIGVTVLNQYNPISGFLRSIDTFVVDSLADSDHVSIILFSLSLGGMIGVVSKSGGLHGIVEHLSKFAKTRRKGQFFTWLMGIFIFFDDYANTLLVGNTMRPYTDKLKISREKLSFIVDSTAAPVAGLAIISTWVGFELGQIDSSMAIIGNVEFNTYDLFLSSLPFNFYSIFMLFFVLFVTLSGRDFGPMLKAERRAINEGKVLSEKANPLVDDSLEEEFGKDIKPSALNAIVPILSVILITIVGILYTGMSDLGLSIGDLTFSNLRDAIGSSNPYVVLLWASFGGSIIAGTLTIGTKSLTMSGVIDAWVNGIKSMVLAILILTLAWTLSAVCLNLNTNFYIISLMGDSIPIWLLPALVFILGAATSFATGTSYGTMGILFPLVIPLTYTMLGDMNIVAVSGTVYSPVFLGVIGSVLAGSLFGDHCSPISDTTVMSSMASGADHIDHVRTQIPYALTVGVVAIIFGYIPSSLGINPWLCLILGLITLFLILRFVGKKAVEEVS